MNQLSNPIGICVDDDDQCMYIADHQNHRIVKWKNDEKNGQIVAGGNEAGNRTDQLNGPTDVLVDKRNDSLIICDCENKRVVRWPRRNGKNGQIIISDIDCCRLTMDDDGDLYVSDRNKHEVRRWKIGEVNGTIVAGGNGKGSHLNQLNNPTFIFVDQDHSVYVSDWKNHRVMKWMKGAEEGIVVAGGQREGHGLTQLSYPQGVIVDRLSHVYVADSSNRRITRWSIGSEEGCIVVGENGQGQQPIELNNPLGLSFDRQSNLYVVDHTNNRVQKFHVDST